MDELRSGLGLIQKSYIIGPEEEKDARISADTNREWATLIETINAIRKALKPFFINKGAHVLRDLMKAMIKSGAILATTHNGWSNNEMALEYLKHFHRHARPIGVYRLLILDGHSSHATFRFKELAHEYKIILLYLPAHTTHRLQSLDVGIFGPQSGFYSNEIVQHSRWARFNVSKREYLNWMLAARKKANTTSNILSAWKKAGLVPFNPDFVLEALSKVKKYTSED
jgi:hypothetical protein